MSISFGGFPYGKISYMTPASINSYLDVVLLSADGEIFSTNRLVLASASPMFYSMVRNLDNINNLSLNDLFSTANSFFCVF